MPRSIVVYTKADRFSELALAARTRFETSAVKPYTMSFPQKTDAVTVRGRITELADGALAPLIEDVVRKGEVVVPSGADRDVRSTTYAELLDDADRSTREAVLQFVSPVIIDIDGTTSPFPVISVIFRQYIALWNNFSGAKIASGTAMLDHVRVKDFKISCVAGRYGKGAQGWLALELDRGRTEEEIKLFNALIDYSFFCGTGLHTDEGLGQTRRLPGKR